jgi:hypothetical protein
MTNNATAASLNPSAFIWPSPCTLLVTPVLSPFSERSRLFRDFPHAFHAGD